MDLFEEISSRAGYFSRSNSKTHKQSKRYFQPKIQRRKLRSSVKSPSLVISRHSEPFSLNALYLVKLRDHRSVIQCYFPLHPPKTPKLRQQYPPAKPVQHAYNKKNYPNDGGKPIR